MADFESEDSLDGALIIDEPNYDSNKIEILSDSDSDVEIVELDDDINDISSTLNSSNSTNGLTCKQCSRIFSTNNDLLNHIRKFKGRIGGCTSVTNVKLTTIKRKAVDLTPENFIKKKRDRPPKLCAISTPVPDAIPLCTQIIPEMIPIIYKPTPPPNIIMPSLRQILVDEIEPEYPCTICGQIFRHNIGLICHVNSEHITSDNAINAKKKSPTTLSEKKQIMKKNDIKDNKQIENDEPISNTINLTLSSDFKKDSLLNRMKSYVYSANKNQVICVLCNVEFKTTKKALAHVEDKHISEKIECGYCNMKFVYKLKLRSHMAKRHKIIAVYECDKCSKMINKEECELHLEKCKGKGNLTNVKREEDSNLLN